MVYQPHYNVLLWRSNVWTVDFFSISNRKLRKWWHTYRTAVWTMTV